MNYYTINSMLPLTQGILGVTIIINILLILFVSVKNMRPLINRVLVIQMIGVLGWMCSIFANLWLHDVLVERLIFFWAALALNAQLYFVYLLPGEATRKRSVWSPIHLALGVGSAFMLSSLLPGAVVSSIHISQYGYTIIEPGWLLAGYSGFAFIYILLAIAVLIHKYRTQTVATAKNQVRSVLYGFIVFFIVDLLTNLLLPVVFHIYIFNGIGPVFSLALVAFIIHNIYRYRFLDISLVIQRSLVYTLLLSGVIALYLVLLNIFDSLLPHDGVTGSLASGIVTTLIGIFSVPTIDTWLRRQTDRFLFVDRYQYSSVLQELSETLNRSVDVDMITSCTVDGLTKALRSSGAHIATNLTPAQMKRLPPELVETRAGALIVPLKSGPKLVGCLTLYPKRSGARYTHLDAQLLNTLSYQLALALERALLYQQLQRHSAELEQTIAKRTAELRAAYHDQQAMISNIAHGLKTPLTIIQSELSSLTDESQMAARTGPIQHSLVSMSTFITDLLRLSQLESTTYRLTHTACDLSELLHDIISYVTTLAADRGATLTHQIEPSIYVLSDEKKLEEAILVLISNALKYCHPSRQNLIHITLTATTTAAILAVSDTGVGISSEDQHKIFGRFYRITGQQAELKQGSGLGLAIARALIRKHHGDITVQSHPQRGSTFTITLPRHYPDAMS